MLFHSLILISTVAAAIIPLPSEPKPIPEPPTVSASVPLTTAAASAKITATALEITSVADHVPRDEHHKSRNRVRLHSHNSKATKNREVEILEEKCNDDDLQRIMEDAITQSLSTSKMVISERATRDFGAPFDVICARGHFSYYVEASTYCEVTSLDVTCFAYKSSSSETETPPKVKKTKEGMKVDEKSH